MSRILAILVGLGLVMATAFPVRAAGPERFDFVEEFSYEFVSCTTHGFAFDLQSDVWLGITVTEFEDRAIVQLDWRATVYRSDGEGPVVRDHGRWVEFVTFDEEPTAVIAGVPIHFTLPKVGLVILGAGLGTIVYHDDGSYTATPLTPHMVDPAGELAKPEVQAMICAAFADL